MGEPATVTLPLPSRLHELEALRIRQALAENLGNITRTAEVLGIDRRTLHRKAKALGIDRAEMRKPPELPRSAALGHLFAAVERCVSAGLTVQVTIRRQDGSHIESVPELADA